MGGGKSASASQRLRARGTHINLGCPSKRNGAPAEACTAGITSTLVLFFLICLASAGAALGWALLAPEPAASARSVSEQLRLGRAALMRFRFVAGSTPLSSPWAPSVAVACYAAALVGIRRHVARRVRSYDMQLRPLVFAHNAVLCSLSAALLGALGAALLPEYIATGGGVAGAVRVWCDPRPHALATHRATSVYYANYVLKYYELLDTVLLALRGRPTPTLHVFHHAATLLLCWSQLVDDTAAQVVPISLNLAVHVAMYVYYAMTTLGHDVWWKRHLTRAQIAQFAADVPACAAALLLRMNSERGWGLFGGETHCRGTHRAAYAGIGLLAAYLALFVKLYVDTYVKRSRTRGKAKTA